MKTEHLLILAVVLLLIARAGNAQAAPEAADPYSYAFP